MWRRAIISACLLLAPVVSDNECVVCPPLRSDSVDIVCKYQGKTIQCDSPMVPGTNATLACKYGYKIPHGEDQGYREITCLQGGAWNRSPFSCIPDCGVSVPQGTPLIANGVTVKHGTFPWHVGVYRRKLMNKYEQICGGTLVNPDLVVSAAHCFYDETFGDGALEDASLFMVAAGKYYRLYNWPEKYLQKSSVESIILPERYFGRARNYELDIALLRLETPFNLTTLVKPVCVDWGNPDQRDELQNGSIGKVVGWGLDASGNPSLQLQELNLPYITYGECKARVPQDFKEIIVADKFCAGYLNGSSVCSGDSGGGLCFQSNGLWFLRGIVSVGPFKASTDVQCESNSYTAFTNVGKHLDFIRDVYLSPRAPIAYPVRVPPPGCVPRETNTCVLPEQPKGGSFSIGLCESQCSVEPGRSVPLGTFLIYKCSKGFVLKGINPSFCHHNGWYRPPSCFKACPSLRSKNVDVVCEYGGKTVSCANPMVPGTRANMGCRKFYKASSDHTEITCLEEGVWDHPMLQCVPECGIALDPESPLMVNDLLVKHVGFPWHVRIYWKSTWTGRYVETSRGTLISPDLVISEARGFENVDGSLLNLSSLVVAASKYYLSYYEMEFFSQESAVKEITVNRRYKNLATSTGNNIVLIRLTTPFILTTLVRPVCMDWDDSLVTEHLKSGVIGKVPNDVIEPGRLYKNIEEIDVAFMSRKECRSALGKDNKSLVKTGMFCVHNSNRSSDAIGDDGSGICFQTDGVWYLRGVVHTIKENSGTGSQYTIVMNVGDFLEWIRNAYNVSAAA